MTLDTGGEFIEIFWNSNSLYFFGTRGTVFSSKFLTSLNLILAFSAKNAKKQAIKISLKILLLVNKLNIIKKKVYTNHHNSILWKDPFRYKKACYLHLFSRINTKIAVFLRSHCKSILLTNKSLYLKPCDKKNTWSWIV